MLNVLIGPNGSGKSNFFSFFQLFQQILSGKLQLYVSKQGGADALLHFGRKNTEYISADLSFGENRYNFMLVPTQDNRMTFAGENFNLNNHSEWKAKSGHMETEIDWKNLDSVWIRTFIPIVKTWQIYHFHDTSESAHVKQRHNINDNEYLRPDAGNLAAFLYRLQKNFPERYARIVNLVRFIAPFLGGFCLRPHTDNSEYIELEWYEKEEDKPFKAHQLSDGTIRFICLVTALNQPEELMPEIIMIDEPELGLHPRAIGYLASMLRSVSVGTQVIVSTQSVTFVKSFSINDLIVVDRRDGQTIFQRHNEGQFMQWLEEYTVGDLWEKNVLGGRG